MKGSSIMVNEFLFNNNNNNNTYLIDVIITRNYRQVWLVNEQNIIANKCLR